MKRADRLGNLHIETISRFLPEYRAGNDVMISVTKTLAALHRNPQRLLHARDISRGSAAYHVAKRHITCPEDKYHVNFCFAKINREWGEAC